MARVLVTGSADGLGQMAARLMVVPGTPQNRHSRRARLLSGVPFPD